MYMCRIPVPVLAPNLDASLANREVLDTLVRFHILPQSPTLPLIELDALNLNPTGQPTLDGKTDRRRAGHQDLVLRRPALVPVSRPTASIHGCPGGFCDRRQALIWLVVRVGTGARPKPES